MQGKGTQQRDPMTETVIGAAIEVHRILGPGLLEAVYEKSLAFELGLLGVRHQTQVAVPISYKGHDLGVEHRLDLVVRNRVVVEIKSVETLNAVHDAQLLSYLRACGLSVGLLLNFNVSLLRDGIRRMVI